mmetsp:Transcript_29765/g.91360  ORF Transcript_29765/g.91360 Transcript_29765/m.91360 type:complete len:244 (+) Transcript_29765:206-937(+)
MNGAWLVAAQSLYQEFPSCKSSSHRPLEPRTIIKSMLLLKSRLLALVYNRAAFLLWWSCSSACEGRLFGSKVVAHSSMGLGSSSPSPSGLGVASSCCCGWIPLKMLAMESAEKGVGVVEGAGELAGGAAGGAAAGIPLRMLAIESAEKAAAAAGAGVGTALEAAGAAATGAGSGAAAGDDASAPPESIAISCERVIPPKPTSAGEAAAGAGVPLRMSFAFWISSFSFCTSSQPTPFFLGSCDQ